MNSTLCKSLGTVCRIPTACLLPLLWAGLTAGVQAQFNFTTNSGAITITQYTGPGGDITIPDTISGFPVSTVGSQTFFQVSGLTSVTLGTNVTSIGANAIFQCPNLTSVRIPGSVTNIGEGPFVDCKGLTAILLSNTNPNYSVTNNVLFNKTQTSLIEYPSGLSGAYVVPSAVTNVGEGFIGNSLTSIDVDPANPIYSSTNGVLFDKSQTFLIAYPGDLRGGYTVPSTVSTIVSAAFEFSTGVSSVTIGTNVTSIGAFAFYDCGSLTAISVNPTNAFFSTVDGVLFDKTQTTLLQFPSKLGGSYIVPGTVSDIGDGAFGDAYTLRNVTIPDSVTRIGEEAFYSCVGLSNIVIGAKVATIAPAAFYYCPLLTSVSIPGSVTNIGFEAFAGCQKLAKVCFQGDAPMDGGSIFIGDNALSTISYVAGHAGWGPVYAGIPTAPDANCSAIMPRLDIVRTGGDVVLTWPGALSAYALQSATSVFPAPSWTAALPLPTLVGGQNMVTNPIAGPQKIYRLSR